MDFLNKIIENYALEHSSPENDLMRRVNRETHLEVLQPRMLSGHLQGNFLSVISRMIQPRRILEIGTYTGYSALALADGLSEDGLLITLDNNEELQARVCRYFQEHPKGNQIKHILGNAADILPTLNELFDLVFIDADKSNYALYYDLVFDKIRPGGWIVADNVLWSGKVVDEKAKDKDTETIRAFNRKVFEDERTFKLLLPIRDGLYIAQKL
jgi:predicted O-methyltransferase YrrM